jgi:mannose-6-phosphate isomerase-like protein (cupin superfamily)
MTSGTVVRAEAVQADRTATGARVRTLLDSGPTGERLARRLVDVPPGSQLDGTAGAAGELWFVIEGTGLLDVDGHRSIGVRPDHGLWIPPGANYRLHADGSADLRLDTVMLPDAVLPGAVLPGDPAADHGAPLVCDLSDCAVETTGDRHFRVLFGPGQGCAVATQFVGEIPPGRAPDHSHPYDEVVLVLEGEGVVHVGGAEHAVSAGTCTHLPPGVLHCMENTGRTTMRVLGVFHPADSPAAKLQTH